MDISCEECANFVFDDDEEDYVCCVSMDEDDYIRLNTDSHYQCPYYQCGDEYKVCSSRDVSLLLWRKNDNQALCYYSYNFIIAYISLCFKMA